MRCSATRSIPYTWGLLDSIPRLGRPRVQPAHRHPRRTALSARAAARLSLRASLPVPLRALLDEARARGARRARPPRRLPSRSGGAPGPAQEDGVSTNGVLLEAVDLVKHFPVRVSAMRRSSATSSMPSTACRSRCAAARRSGSSASPAAASRRSAGCSCGCSSRRAARCGSAVTTSRRSRLAS